MSKVKTVCLIVEIYDEKTGEARFMAESTEVGKGLHWSKPSEFINEFSRIYSETSKSPSTLKFKITNVVIG